MHVLVITNCDAVQGFINEGKDNLVNTPIDDVQIMPATSKMRTLSYPIPFEETLANSLWIDGINQNGVVANDYRIHYFIWWHRLENRNQAIDFKVGMSGNRLNLVLVNNEGEISHYDDRFIKFAILSGGNLLKYQGHMGGSDVIETANGRAWITYYPDENIEEITARVEVEGIGSKALTFPIQAHHAYQHKS